MKHYIAITPVRDEEELLPGLIASMCAQTIRPARWIIVNDGSADATRAIIEDAARQHDWITPCHLTERGPRRPGGEAVLMRFLPPALWEKFDYIVRFDADLTFPPDYIAALLAEFERDPALGIASGCLFEPRGSGWWLHQTPEYHTRGPSKVYSRECFAAIGGLENSLGWDTVDEARAMLAGFHTRSFSHIRAYHHRALGGAQGRLRAHINTGRAAFAAGYSPLFMFARSLKHIFTPPVLVAAHLMFAGYVIAWLRREPKIVDSEVVRFIRKQQHRRLMLRQSLWK